MIDKIKDIFTYAQKIPFYQNLYGSRNINNLDNFRQLPLIAKHDTLHQQLHTDDTKIAFLRSTSGTSGTMAVFPRSEKDEEIYLKNFLVQAPFYLSKDNQAIIIFPNDLAFIYAQWVSSLKCPFVFGEMFDIPLSVDLLLKTQADTVITTPTIALKLGEYLSQSNDFLQIKNVFLIGSGLSPLMKKWLTSFLPQARIIQTYGLAETGLIGWQCPDISGQNMYHLYPEDFLYEILDPQTLQETDTGELVLTKLWSESGATLLRYRTADMVERVSTTCSCPEHGPLLAFRGKINFDIIKLGGMTLYKDTFEQSLQTVLDLIRPEYQIHIFEQEKGNQILPQLVLKVTPLKNTDTDETKKIIAEKIMKNFKITTDHVWKDGVTKGLFLPLEVEWVEDFESKNFKFQNIVDHRSGSYL